MRRFDPVVTGALADLLINLSAGWFSLALAIPFSDGALIIKLGLLTFNTTLATICLLSAIKLRKGAKK